MIPKRLKLVNSIGLLDGIGKREIEIDFTQFKRGVVGIFGRTGSGKSTIMENMTPFRKLMTRLGSLHDHFVDEGLREFEFEMEGHIYLSRILIDAPKKKTIAQLYKDGTLLNDKLEEYDGHIAEIIGDYDLFINSVFAPQTDDFIITMKDTPMKSLFMMLFNLEKYSNVYLPLLKTRRDDTEKRLQGVRSAYEVLESDVNEMQTARIEIEKLETSIPDLTKRASLSTLATQKHQESIVKQKQALTRATMNDDNLNDKRKQAYDLQKDIQNAADEIAKDAEEIEVSLTSNGVEADLAISDKETLDREIKRAEKIISNKKLILEKVERLEELKVGLESVGSAEKELLLKQKMHDNIHDDIKRLQRDIEILERVPCIGTEYYEKCELLSNAIQSKDTLKEKEKDGDKTHNEMHQLKTDKELAESIRVEMTDLDKDNWEQVKTELTLAEKSIDGWKERLEKSEQRIIDCAKIKGALEKRLSGLEEKVNKKNASKKEKKTALQAEIKELETSEEITGLEAEIKRLEFLTHKIENEQRAANTDLVAAETRIVEYKKSLELLKRKEESMQSKVNEMNVFIQDIEEWNILEKFFKEAPVYELESAAQITTEFANDLLSLYNDSFSLKIVTVLPKAGNKGLKDVFKIMAFKNGREVLAHNLSGGQKQVFDAALRMGVVLTLGSTQSKKFMSSFWDESASAIDGEYAINYIEMHERALKVSDKQFTFVISHHEKTQSMVDQKILVEDL